MGAQKPAWLEALESQRFFVGCSLHGTARKNEKNICCLDCCTSICPHCLPSHRSHGLVQVRRYVYHDVVRLQDLDKLIDCSNVQSYRINGSQVVFIKKRPQSRQLKGSGNTCSSCDRILQDPYLHCSLGCKVDFLVRHKSDLSLHLRTSNESLRLSPDFLTHHDHMDMEDSDRTESTHSAFVDGGDEAVGSSSTDSEIDLSMPSTDVVQRSSESLLHLFSSSARGPQLNVGMAACLGRRKGIPHRSPLC